MKSPNAHMLLLVLLLSASSAVLSTEEPFSYMALGGLKEVTVRVDGIHRDFSRFGLAADALKKATEEKLNANGINVVTSETAQSDPSVGRLRIKLNANENQYRFYHYGINLQLEQKVPISQQGGYVSQTTWTSGRTGVVMPMELRRMNELAADLVDIFVKDYKAQNPSQFGAIDSSTK